jgi:hypothetical protein
MTPARLDGEVTEVTEVTDLKNGATKATAETKKKKTDCFPFSSLSPLLRF